MIILTIIDMKNLSKITVYIWLFLVLLLISAAAYLYLTLNPVNTANSKIRFLAEEIPTISEILNPRIILNEGISVADDKKVFYSAKLNEFSKWMENFPVKDTQFIKKTSISYVVSGNVYSVKEIKDKGSDEISSYQITLYNSNGDKFIEIVNMNEVNILSAYLQLMSLTNPLRSETTISEIEVNDYLILERSTNLLTESSKTDIRIELLRSAK